MLIKLKFTIWRATYIEWERPIDWVPCHKLHLQIYILLEVCGHEKCGGERMDGTKDQQQWEGDSESNAQSIYCIPIFLSFSST